jgi:quinoprotein glucose dehydrogenase
MQLTRSRLQALLAAFVMAGLAASLAAQSSNQARRLPSTANGEWVSYAADVRGTRYMPLDQIDASNFSKLELAWRFSTNNLGPRPEFVLQGTPLMIGRTLYATGGGGNRRAIVAIDAKTRAPKRRRAGCRAVASRTGRMAAATSASST